jgi:SAM-dependent methyltransferase
MTGPWVRFKEIAMRSPAVRRVNSWRRETRVGMRPAQEIWNEGIGHELAYWEDAIRDPGWAAENAHRLDPQGGIQEPEVAALLDEVESATVSLLDVGAGPLTALGKTHPGKTLQITATDPLADEYNRILDEVGIDPPVRTLACPGEDLLDRFEPGTFDVVFARNALDHSYDAPRVIDNMVALAKPGGHVVLRHRRSEGRVANYVGLHQWNFNAEDGTFILSRGRRERVDVTRRLAGVAAVRAEISDYSWVICVIAKLRR